MEVERARRARVERLEREYETAPAAYRVRLILLAALGYAVLGGALVFTVGLTVVLIGLAATRPQMDWNLVFPIAVLGLTGVAVVRALWVRFEPPPGHALRPDEAQPLQEEVERIRHAMGARRLHGIVIDESLNAAAAYVPAGFGLFRQRHYLVLGLPLLQLLDRRELAAVIGHEFGHFHGGDGHFSAWIYRLRIGWHRVLQGLSDQNLASQQLFLLFFRWYAPHFDERSFVLARRQEYAADAAAAQLAGAQASASALARIHLASAWLEREFWPEVERSARDQAYPPVHVHANLSRRLAALRSQQRRLPAWSLAHAASAHDTHPGLAQRLAALGVESDLGLEDAHPPAADEMLGATLRDQLEQRFSREWQEAARPDWEARHRRAREAQRRLLELEREPRRTPEEWLEYAALVEEHRPGTDAVPLYREGLGQRPAHAAGHCRMGILLLRQGREADGLEHLERAMRLEPGLIPSVLQEFEDHLRSQPDTSPLHAAAVRLHEAFVAPDSAGHVPEDEFQPHALGDEPLQALRRVLAGHERVAAAWVVRQKAPGLSVSPHYLLLLEWSGSVASEQAGIPSLSGQLALPGTFVVLTTTQCTPLLRRLRPKSGEPVYRRR